MELKNIDHNIEKQHLNSTKTFCNVAYVNDISIHMSLMSSEDKTNEILRNFS